MHFFLYNCLKLAVQSLLNNNPHAAEFYLAQYHVFKEA